MEPAIGLIETNSVAAGIQAGDAMVKRAPIRLLEARSICPGKYMVLVSGETAPVEEAMQAGLALAGDAVVDRLRHQIDGGAACCALLAQLLLGHGNRLGQQAQARVVGLRGLLPAGPAGHRRQRLRRQPRRGPGKPCAVGQGLAAGAGLQHCGRLLRTRTGQGGVGLVGVRDG